MGKPGKDGKPRGRMSAYAFFVQTCREEHKKKHPAEQVIFAEFSKKCAEKWKVIKSMSVKEKKRFQDMADKDKIRYDREMSDYIPPKGEGKRKRKTKDPNAPKRALSAFFFFCNEERGSVKVAFPSYGVADIAKELGKRWEKCTDRPRFGAMAEKDKGRYERDMVEYRRTGLPVGSAAAKKAKVVPPKPKVEEEEEEDDDDDNDDDDDDDDDDEEEDE